MLSALMHQKESVQESNKLILIPRYQLELKDAYIARVSRLAEEERKNKGDLGERWGSVFFSSDKSF